VEGTKVILVEGITDVWRLGPGAIATFGIAFTKEQIKLLKQFEEVFIWFDSDRNAQRQADRIAQYISALGKEAEIINVGGYEDPASVPQKEAKKLVRQILS
jgi:DNA primase